MEGLVLDYHEKIKEYLHKHNLIAQHLELNESCHTVKEAAKAVNGTENEFVKNICMIDAEGQLIIAIVKGEDRASTSRVSKALNIDRPRLANEEEVLKGTGYPAGGVPSFGFEAIFIIDSKVTELEYVYTGGGSPYSLVKMSVNELLKANNGTVARIRK